MSVWAQAALVFMGSCLASMVVSFLVASWAYRRAGQ